MRRRIFSSRMWLPVACAWVCTLADRGFACAVCFGDSESPMAKGVVAGVVVLIAVVGAVLFAVAGTGVYWMQRSRRMVQGVYPEQSTGLETQNGLGAS